MEARAEKDGSLARMLWGDMDNLRFLIVPGSFINYARNGIKQRKCSESASRLYKARAYGLAGAGELVRLAALSTMGYALISFA